MTTPSFTPLTDIEADVLRYVRDNHGRLPPFALDVAHSIRRLKDGGCLKDDRQRLALTGHGEMMLRKYEEQHGNP